MFLAALVGFAFAWIGSIPIAGPIAALVVLRGMNGQYRAGAMVALGGALVEGLYACVAFWGFSTFLGPYPWIEPVSRLAAALVLAGLGVAFLRQRDGRERVDDGSEAPGPWKSFGIGATICALNPTLIATWTVAVTTLRGAGFVGMQGAQAVPFAVGVTCGIAGWFLTMLWLMRRFRHRVRETIVARSVRFVGAALLVLAAWFGVRFAQYYLSEPAAQAATN